MLMLLKIIFVLQEIASLFGGKYNLYSVEAGIIKTQTLKDANEQIGNKRDIEKENTKMYHLMAQHIGPNDIHKDLNANYPNYDAFEFEEKKIDSLKEIKNATEITTMTESSYTISNIASNKRRSVRTNVNKIQSFGNEKKTIVGEEKTGPHSLKSDIYSSFHSSKPREIFKHRRQAFKLNRRKLYGPQKKFHDSQNKNPQQSIIGLNPSNAVLQNNMVVSKKEPFSTQHIIEKLPEKSAEENESESTEATENFLTETLMENNQYHFPSGIYSPKSILEPLTDETESTEYLTEETSFANSSEFEISTQNPYIKAGPINIKISNDTSPHKLKMGIRPNSNTNLTLRIERQNGGTLSDAESDLKNVEKKDVAEKTIANNNELFERDIYKPGSMNGSVDQNTSAALWSDSKDVSKMAFPLWQLSKDSNGRVKWDLRQNSEKSKYIEISNQQLIDDSGLENNIIYGTDNSGYPKLKLYSYNCKTLLLNIFRKHTAAAVVLIIIILFIFVLFIYIIYKAGQRSQCIKYRKLDDSDGCKRENNGTRYIKESIHIPKESRKEPSYHVSSSKKSFSDQNRNNGKRVNKVSLPVFLRDSQSQTISFEKNRMSSSAEESYMTRTKDSRKSVHPIKPSRNIQSIVENQELSPKFKLEREDNKTPVDQNQRGLFPFFTRIFSKSTVSSVPTKDQLEKNRNRHDTDHISPTEFEHEKTKQDVFHKSKFSAFSDSDESETETENVSSVSPLKTKRGICYKIKKLLTPERQSDDGSESANEGTTKSMKAKFRGTKRKGGKPKRKKPAPAKQKDLKYVIRKTSFDIASTSPASNASLKSKIGTPGDCKPIDDMLSGEEWNRSLYSENAFEKVKSKQLIKEHTEKRKLSEIELMELLADKVVKVIDNADNAIKHPQPAKHYEHKIKQIS